MVQPYIDAWKREHGEAEIPPRVSGQQVLALSERGQHHLREWVGTHLSTWTDIRRIEEHNAGIDFYGAMYLPELHHFLDAHGVVPARDDLDTLWEQCRQILEASSESGAPLPSPSGV